MRNKTPLVRLSPLNVTRWIEADRNWRKLSYALIVLVGVILALTFRHYGLTWDEAAQISHGKAVIAWYTSFFQDRTAADIDVFDDMVFYGRFFEVVALLAAKVLPFGYYESQHLVNCLFGLTGIVAAYKLGSHLLNSMSGFFSALFLTLTPLVHGHSFNDTQDTPFATLYVISLYFIVVSYDYMPRVPKKLLVKIGVSIGLAMGVRCGGILLCGYVAVFWSAWFIVRWRSGSSSSFKNARKMILPILSSFVIIVIIAWVTMLVWWPWAQMNPLRKPFEALAWFAGGFASNIGSEPNSLFNGHYVPWIRTPWNYLPTWFSLQLPEFYFIALPIGCVLAASFILRFRKHAANFEKLIKMTIIGLAVVFPIMTAIILRTPLYDGMRHFLFVIPPLAVLAAVSFSALLRSRIKWIMKAGISASIAVFAALTVIDMIQLHPYEYIYFNRAIAGGLKGVYQKFETDYMGSSYKEGMEWVIENYHPDTKDVIRIEGCGGFRIQTDYYLDKSEGARRRFRYINADESPNIYLTVTAQHCSEARSGPVLHRVERQGVPILFVMEVERPK